jgi:hypothetical protein
MPNVVGLAYHNGDPMSTTEGNTLDDSLAITSYPSAAVDRCVWQTGTSTYAFGLSRSVWRQACNVRAAVTSPVSIDVTAWYNQVNRLYGFSINFNILADMTGEYYFNIIISEDSLNYEQTTTTGSLDPYYHMHVVRKMLLATFGSRLTTTGFTQGQVINKTYSVPTPASANWNLNKCHVTVVLSKKYTSAYGHREVQQAWQKRFFDVMQVVPVKLVSFLAERSGSDARLNWRTASESNNRGWDVERRIDLGTWEKIGFVNGYGTTSDGQTYEYTDHAPARSGIVDYRLRQIDFDGGEDVSPVSRVSFEALPTTTRLLQNFPNPFNPTTQIGVELAEAGPIRVEVFDALGRSVSVIADGEYTAGMHFLRWDAFDGSGNLLPSGLYYCRLTAGNHTETRQMMMTR